MVHKLVPKPSFLDDCVYVKVIKNRKVWRSQDSKRYYTWDSLHGEIEVFNKRGKHLGSIDSISGEYLKSAVKGRTLDD